MNEELKPCSICGQPAEQMWDPEENIIRCTNGNSYCHNALYGVYYGEWQSRPLEDALRERAERAEAELAKIKTHEANTGLAEDCNPVFLRKYIEKLEAELASLKDWHPASEPPEIGDPKSYLVCVRGDGYAIARYTPYDTQDNRDWLSDAYGFLEITHWRELPAPEVEE